MEFDREIVAEILDNIPVDPKDVETLPYVQSRAAVTGYDYTEMNALLSSFLDRLTEDYLRQR
jgi:hypothetical protein